MGRGRGPREVTGSGTAGSAAQGGDRPLGTITVILAVACGLSVANLYYAQPLLDALAEGFGVPPATAALVVTASQIGYAAGLVLLVPLGDLVENRVLAVRVLAGTALTLTLAAASPSLSVLVAAAAAIGLTSVVAQILVPLAAHLAPEARRGQIVGQVMSGLLLGILLARTVSSLIAAALGWRAVYALSAAFMVVLALVLARTLPVRQPETDLRYPALLRSVASLLRTEPVLRCRAAIQACMFATFTVYWTAISYELAGRHHLSQAHIGLFALIGAAGAATAPLVGWLGDRGWGRAATGGALIAGAAAMAMSGLGSGNVVVLGATGVLLDAAAQTTLVIGQQAVYAVRPEARARMNTAFIATFFLGGAAGSALAGTLYNDHGWTAVAALGTALPLLAFLGWLLQLRPSRTRAQEEVAVGHYSTAGRPRPTPPGDTGGR